MDGVHPSVRGTFVISDKKEAREGREVGLLLLCSLNLDLGSGLRLG